jgi:hypothetical protein
MMKWDYRVFREEDGTYVIREVYYDTDGAIVACTQDSVEPFGDSLEELARDIEWFKEALTRPVLTLADVPKRQSRNHAQTRNTNGRRTSIEEVRQRLGLNPFKNEESPRLP